MAGIQQDIDIYINKAQSKIALIGDDMRLADYNGLDISDSVMLIQELDASVYLLQNRPSDFTDTQVYELISTYNYKAKLTTLPLSLFLTDFNDNVLLETGGFLVGPQGPQGDKGVQGDKGDLGANGVDGTNGNNGWAYIPALVVDSGRSPAGLVIQVAGWTGGTGTPPPVGAYIGASGFVTLISDAIDVRGTVGAAGVTGATGPTGASGTSFYTYIAYASDSAGTGFTTTFDANLDYIGIITSTITIPSPSPSNFIGLWKNYKGAKGDPFNIDAMGNLSGRNTYNNESTGFTYYATDTGDIYIKNSNVSGDWSAAISFVGDKGWSPILSVITDGERRVFQITNWVGGQGVMPSVTDQFLGASDIVNTAAAAVDIRGGTGNFIINAQDTLANRTTYDAQAVPFIFLATDNGKIYFKASNTSGDWTAGFQWTGEQGIQGDPGSAGINAFTLTNGTFIQPAASATVNVTVDNTSWMSIGQVVFIETGGYYQVNSVGSSTVVTLTNLNYPGNASPSAVIPDNSKVSPSGIGNSGGATWGAITGTLPDQIDLQGALDAKQDLITGAATTVVSSNLSANFALISNGSGKIGVSSVTATELGYLSGVTSAIQTQFASKLNVDGTIAMTGNLDLGGNNAINVNIVKVNDGGGLYNTSNNAHINLESDGHIDFTATGISASTVPYFDASRNLISSSVTPTELGYLSGATSSLQNQINNINAGLSWKPAARVATTANITLSGTQTIDGVAVIAGDRVLVKNQTTASQNGIYVCASGSWSRSTDSNTGTSILQATVSIEEGSVNADIIYTCTTDAPITIGTTSITFAKTSATTYTSSNGVSLSGNNFTLDNSYFTGEISLSGGVGTLLNSAVIGKVLTGYASGAGTVASTDTILQAIQKLNGNASAIISSQWTTTGSDIYYSTGGVMIGTNSTASAKLHTVDTGTGSPRGIIADQYNTGVNSSQLNMRKARGTFASPTTIVTADILSNLNSWAHDGTNFINASAIRVTSVGTIGTGRTPTKMEFYTMTDVTTGVLTVALTLDQLQNATFNSTGAVTLSVGTTAQQPTGVTGMTRYNTDTSRFEFYSGGWRNFVRLDGDTMTGDLGFASAKGIKDANGNYQIAFPSTVSSPVNFLTVSNAATTTNPLFTASGTDSNIGFDFVPKGTGALRMKGPIHIWDSFGPAFRVFADVTASQALRIGGSSAFASLTLAMNSIICGGVASSGVVIKNQLAGASANVTGLTLQSLDAGGFAMPVVVRTGNCAGTSQVSGDLSLSSGNGTGSNTSSGNVKIFAGTFTGTGTRGYIQIGNDTSSLVGFYGTTGIVQVTTAISASTFTTNTSGIANDTATWDGYTIGQIVKALRNFGLLA